MSAALFAAREREKWRASQVSDRINSASRATTSQAFSSPHGVAATRASSPPVQALHNRASSPPVAMRASFGDDVEDETSGPKVLSPIYYLQQF